MIVRRHRYMADEPAGGLDDPFVDDVVLYSPVVCTPQSGKEITGGTSPPRPVPWRAGGGAFRYTNPVLADDTEQMDRLLAAGG